MNRYQLDDFPPVVEGYPLEHWRVSVVKPRAATNLILNPSAERDTTGYTAAGGSIARSAAQQRRGVYSLAVTPTAGVFDGVYYTTSTLAAGTLYYFSVDVKGAPGVPYKIQFATTGAVELAVYMFRGTGKWQRVWLAYAETSAAARRLYISKHNHTSTAPFYVDGLQVETDRLTTYLDGDQRGFVKNQAAYYWTGTAHASTSVRIAATRAGGEEMLLKDFGFSVLALIGLGLGGFVNLSTPNAYLGGSQYERTVQQGRTFDLVGAFAADTPLQLDRQISDLSDILQPGAGLVQQPMSLRFQRVDEHRGTPLGEPAEVVASFKGGLDGNRTNYFQERTALTFEVFLPYVARLDGESGAALGYRAGVANANYLIQRSPIGVYSAIRTGAQAPAGGGSVFAMAQAQNGRVYFGGKFDTLDSVANTIGSGYFSNGVFTALGTGLQGLAQVYSLQVLPNEDVVYAGSFTGAGGVGSTANIARWRAGAAAWTNAGNANNAVTALAYDYTAGKLYAGGQYTNIGGAAINYLAQSTDSGASWAAVGAGPGSQVLSLAWGPDGRLYMGLLDNTLRVVSGTTYTLLDTFAAIPSSLAFAKDGRLYFAVDTGGNTYFYYWNGTASVNFLTVPSSGNPRIFVGPDDLIYIPISADSVVNGVTFKRGLAVWSGSTLVYSDFQMPASDQLVLTGFLYLPDSTIYFGLGSAVIGPFTATAAQNTTVTSLGSSDAYPVFTLTGPGTVYQLKNYTTGDTLFFNLALASGEIATLDLTPGQIRFYSNFRPNLLNTILPGSNFGFRLAPGDNAISVFVAGTTDANTAATLRLTPAYGNLEKTLYR